MNRIESITTRVRPIKKLFVVDSKDINRFTEIIRLLSHEIAGITNVIIPFSPKIYEENIAQFVSQHDPDILINYSDADPRMLERHFRLDTFPSPPIDEVRRMASTRITLWDNIPSPLFIMTDNPGNAFSGDVFSVVANEMEPVDLFAALHFGIISPELVDSLQHGIFRGIRVRNISSNNMFTLLPDHQQNFTFLTLGLAAEHGPSLGEKDGNPSRFFDQKPTIILGSYSDVGGMTYFWNARASYPFNRTIWLPIELVDAVQLDLHEYTHLVVTTNLEGDPRAQALQAGRQLIDSSLYYFPPHADRWISFEHTTTASVIGSKIKVDHPSYKLFSRRGINMNFALDVEGLEEVLAPSSAAVGKLFDEASHHA